MVDEPRARQRARLPEGERPHRHPGCALPLTSPACPRSPFLRRVGRRGLAGVDRARGLPVRRTDRRLPRRSVRAVTAGGVSVCLRCSDMPNSGLSHRSVHPRLVNGWPQCIDESVAQPGHENINPKPRVRARQGPVEHRCPGALRWSDKSQIATHAQDQALVFERERRSPGHPGPVETSLGHR